MKPKDHYQQNLRTASRLVEMTDLKNRLIMPKMG